MKMVGTGALLLTTYVACEVLRNAMCPSRECGLGLRGQVEELMKDVGSPLEGAQMEQRSLPVGTWFPCPVSHGTASLQGPPQGCLERRTG